MRVRPGPALAAVGVVALLSRVLVALWGFSRFPPIADGTFYDLYARRIAAGLGYTTDLGDGAFAYASHYPVGYPALLALAYRVGEPAPGWGMIMNALLGALGSIALHHALIQLHDEPREPPVSVHAAALVFALHPGLLTYIPALMTEGLTAALFGCVIWVGVRVWRAETRPGRAASWLGLGLLVGGVTLVRPQTLVLLPLFALALGLATRSRTALVSHAGATRHRWARGLAALMLAAAGAVCVVAPWTLRNCERVGRCALVSTNGGWNLLIGTDPEAKGSWAPVKVPPACAEVWDEGEKDACFGREGMRAIARDPKAWAALAPQKLSATFDYIGSGPWYLNAGNPGVFSFPAKVRWAVAEIVVNRALIALGIVAASLRALRLRPVRIRRGATALLAATALLPWGWVGILVLALACLGASRESPAGPRLGYLFAAALLLSTSAVHVLFFGSGRYGLLVLPALCLVVADLGWAFDMRGDRPDD